MGSLMGGRAYTGPSPNPVEPPPAVEAAHEATVRTRFEVRGDDGVGDAGRVDPDAARDGGGE